MVLCIHHSINFLKFNIYYYFCHYYVKNLLPTCSPPIPFNAMYKIKTTPFIEGYLLPMSYSSTGTSSHNNIEMEGEVMGSKPTECLCNLLIKKKKVVKGTSLFVSSVLLFLLLHKMWRICLRRFFKKILDVHLIPQAIVFLELCYSMKNEMLKTVMCIILNGDW